MKVREKKAESNTAYASKRGEERTIHNKEEIGGKAVPLDTVKETSSRRKKARKGR